MLTFDDIRGLGVSRMMTSSNFVNPANLANADVLFREGLLKC